MPTFQYTARDRSGALVRGSMEAASDAEVRARLQENRYHLLDVAATALDIAPSPENRLITLEAIVAEAADDMAVFPAEAPVDAPLPRIRPPRQGVVVPARALAKAYRSLAVTLRSGVPVYQAVQGARQQTQNPVLARALLGMEASALYGRPLSEAMARHPRAFRKGHVGIVRVGEGSGSLPASFKALADQMDADWSVEISLRWNPLFFIMRWVVTPILAVAFLASAGLGRSGMDVSRGVVTLAMLGLIGMLAYPAIVAGLRRVPWGGALLDGINRLPVLGARGSRSERVHTLSALVAGLEAGVPLSTAWELSTDATDSEAIRAVMMAQGRRLRRGASVSEALSATGLYDETVIEAARYGEYTGSLPQSLKAVIAYDRQEAALIGALIPWVVATIAYFLYLLVGTWLVLYFWGL